jgi:hypothetical protein
MKDFYDILYLASAKDFDSSILNRAILETFQNRNTNIENMKYIFSDNFINDSNKQIMWKAFIKKRKLETDNDFKNVMKIIEKFLHFTSQKNTDNRKWNHDKFSWK